MIGALAPIAKLDVYLDLCCPFSKKMFMMIAGQVAPAYTEKADASRSRVEFVVHHVPQPWHAQSSYMHEACLAVKNVAGAQKYLEYCAALFAAQEQFFDDATIDKPRRAIYADLAALAANYCGVDAAAVLAELELTGPGNAGSKVTQALKWEVKHHRAQGVHVTPTVFLNGIEAVQIGSGWSLAEWTEFLGPPAVDGAVHPAS